MLPITGVIGGMFCMSSRANWSANSRMVGHFDLALAWVTRYPILEMRRTDQRQQPA